MTTKARSFRHQWAGAVALALDLDYDVRGLLIAIAERFMAADGMNVWASQATIAEQCGGTRKMVNRLLGEAQAAGWVVYEERPDRRGRVRLHLTPVVPKTGHEVVPFSGLARVPKTGHEHSAENTGTEHDQLAVPDGPGGREATGRLVTARLDAIEGKIHGDPIVAKAVGMDSPFPGCFTADLDEATGVVNAERVLLVLDAVLIAQQRLPQPMKRSQIDATVTMLLDMYAEVDDDQWAAMGKAAEWREVTSNVTDPVLLIFGSFRTQIESEAGRGAVAGH